jgi:hypothetical protein
MKKPEETKLIPRNAPAFRKSSLANPTPRLNAGNPISTRLESGIGNCFPGLECDLRNLERRFFPFLEVDIEDTILVVSVDTVGVAAARASGKLTSAAFEAYAKVATGTWTVDTIAGTFGPLGKMSIRISDLRSVSTGKRRRPVDAWTAVRVLTEGTQVRLGLVSDVSGGRISRVTLTGNRQAYLGDDGALASIFLPGELTQSLCSPWTHDFRDCACYYWASNHPDIAMPPLPSTPTNDPRWDMPVAWERQDRTLDKLPKPATVDDPESIELRHFEINRRWQELNFVIERREQTGPYLQRKFDAKPLADDKELIAHLRYAAGVELAVLQEYLAAAYSLRPDVQMKGALLDNVRAARAELRRIAIGEMNHLRAVNDVLAARIGRPKYRPALGVATTVPGKKSGSFLPVSITALTRDAVDRFIAIEAPSQSVDGVYARIFATLEQIGRDEEIQAIRGVMAEGEDHYRTFLAIQEWLAPHAEAEYLRAPNMKRPPAQNPANKHLQTLYSELLRLLYEGFSAGMPFAADKLNAARNEMIGAAGLDFAAEDVAKGKFLVVFNVPRDRRFAPVDHP